MIKSRKELNFYIQADRMMNRGYFKPSFKQMLINILFPDHMMSFLKTMRKCDYYSNLSPLSLHSWGGVFLLLNKLKYRKLSLKLGLSIGYKVFGYGLVIPHYGTIVVGGSNRIGNYAVLHCSTCISDNGKIIGDGLYLATGAKITSKLTLGRNVSVAANSVVNKSFEEDNILLAGAPAVVKTKAPAWYVRDGELYSIRMQKIERLKSDLGL